MEQSNRFFIFDSYVFALKNAFTNARLFFFTYLILSAVPVAMAFLCLASKATFIESLFMLQFSWKEALINYLLTAPALMFGIFLLALLFVTWIIVALMIISLRIHDTGTAAIKDLFPSPILFVKAFIGGLLLACITVIGLILFVVPGIYFIVRALFYFYALIEGDGIFESFSTSFRLTERKVWQLLPLVLLAGAIMKFMFFGVPVMYISGAYVYRLLKKEAH